MYFFLLLGISFHLKALTEVYFLDPYSLQRFNRPKNLDTDLR